jgi:uncharacterized protein
MAAVTCVDFATRRPTGRLLPGTLTLPAAPSSDVVVLLHGLLSNKDHNFAPLLADTLARTLGCAVYRFDFRTRPSPEEPSFRYRFCGVDEDLEDTVAAVETLRADRGLRTVAVVGHSRGANIALLYAAATSSSVADDVEKQRCRVFVGIAPRFRMAGMLDKFAPEQLAQLEETGQFVWAAKGTGFSGDVVVTRDDIAYVQTGVDMAAAVRRIPEDARLLLLHGAADKTIPAEDSRLALAARVEAGGGEGSAAARNTSLVVVSGANHTFQGSKLTDKLLRAVTDFVGVHALGREDAGAGAGAEAGAEVAAASASPSPKDAGSRGSGGGSKGGAGKDKRKGEDKGKDRSKGAAPPAATAPVPAPAAEAAPKSSSPAELETALLAAWDALGSVRGVAGEDSLQAAAAAYALRLTR